MGHVLQGTEMDPLVVPKLLIRHVPMILEDLSNMFGWERLFSRVDVGCLSAGAESLALEGIPFPRFRI